MKKIVVLTGAGMSAESGLKTFRDANGLWGYIEDCDGTLIAFVETHKIPIIKHIGLNLNLNKRDPLQPVPNWIIKAMQLMRVKNFRNN